MRPPLPHATAPATEKKERATAHLDAVARPPHPERDRATPASSPAHTPRKSKKSSAAPLHLSSLTDFSMSKHRAQLQVHVTAQNQAAERETLGIQVSI
jgi:hypothetical protein